jgi:hypothetical protein
VFQYISFRLEKPQLHASTLERLHHLAKRDDQREWLDFALARADVNAPDLNGLSFAVHLLRKMHDPEDLALFSQIFDRIDLDQRVRGQRIVRASLRGATLGSIVYHKALFRIMQADVRRVMDDLEYHMVRPELRQVVEHALQLGWSFGTFLGNKLPLKPPRLVSIEVKTVSLQIKLRCL